MFRLAFGLNHSPQAIKYSSSSEGGTIFALSSGHGKCGVAVIRISGQKAGQALKQITKGGLKGTLEPRIARLQTLIKPESQEPLDRALTLWFPGPHSFTGEDCAELHVHGGVAVVSAVLQTLGKMEGLRPATAGEFTRRAFAADKLDLTQVEGLGDLIHAETEHQRKAALRQMGGDMAKKFGAWREQILKIVAHVEAYIDFAESEEIEDGLLPEVVEKVKKLSSELEGHVKDARCGERLRSGVQIAIIGEPNVGKSSLLNHLAERPAAIVSPIAGTTRDIVETRIDLGGYPIIIMDTAGLRQDTSDVIEQEGMSRAVSNAKSADLIVTVIDAKTLIDSPMIDLDEKFANFGVNLNKSKRICIANKVDLLTKDEMNQLKGQTDIKFVSCQTEEGLHSAMDDLCDKVKDLCTSSFEEDPLLTRSRHRHHIEKAKEHLDSFLESIEPALSDPNYDLDFAIVSHQLRLTIGELGKLTGHVGSEQILDVIFADFCIGK